MKGIFSGLFQLSRSDTATRAGVGATAGAVVGVRVGGPVGAATLGGLGGAIGGYWGAQSDGEKAARGTTDSSGSR